MDKWQAIHSFWSRFGLKAYDEGGVPEDAVMPYITYNVSTDGIGTVVLMSGSLWYRSMGWETISKKADEIAEYIAELTPPTMEIDRGRMYVTHGSPFAQRMTDPDFAVKRIVINIRVEFFTSF